LTNKVAGVDCSARQQAARNSQDFICSHRPFIYGYLTNIKYSPFFTFFEQATRKRAGII
jgi:hypothetical protein